MNINELLNASPQFVQDLTAFGECILEKKPAAAQAIRQLTERLEHTHPNTPLSNEYKLLFIAVQFRMQEIAQSVLFESACKERFHELLEKFVRPLPTSMQTALRVLVEFYFQSPLKNFLNEESIRALIDGSMEAIRQQEPNPLGTIAFQICLLAKKALQSNKASSSTPDPLVEQMSSLFNVLCEIGKLQKKPTPAPQPIPTVQPFQETVSLLPESIGTGAADLVAQYQYDLSEALQDAKGDVFALPPQWRERLPSVHEVTLHGIDMTYAKLEALAVQCTALRKITLTRVTLNGQRFYDDTAIAIFFPKERAIEIVGAPCQEEREWLSTVTDFHESLGLTKAAVWELYLQLHNQEHRFYPQSTHGVARDRRLDEVGNQLLPRLAELGASSQTTGQ